MLLLGFPFLLLYLLRLALGLLAFSLLFDSVVFGAAQ